MDSFRGKETLQDIAKKMVQEKIKSEAIESNNERTLFFLGSSDSGKTSVIYNFLERDDPIKPTLALDYSFGRRTGHSRPLICNFWELGSVENSEKLMEIPFRGGKDVATTSVVFILDLSNPEDLWPTIEASVTQIREIISRITPKEELLKLLETSSFRLGENSADSLPSLDLFPVPVLVVGSKYDLFQNLDPEVRKQVCRCIRSVSHLIGASVLFYSTKLNVNSKVLRDVLNSMAFNTVSKPIQSMATDYMKPLLIPCGHDNWEKIGIPSASFREIGANFNKSLNFTGKRKPKKELPKDPAKDKDFLEPAIDEARAHKEQEILSFARNADIRVQFENIVDE